MDFSSPFLLQSQRLSYLVAVTLAMMATAARAQTVSTWTGGTGNWGNGALWSNGIPNSTGADAYIDGGKAGTASSVTLESSRSVGRLTVDLGDSLTFAEGIALNVYNGAFTGSGSVVNNGTITLAGSGGGFPTLQFYGVGTISGTGTLTLGGVNARIITATAGDRITIGAGQTVGGQGNLGGGAATFTNNGTVTANQNGAALALRPGSGTGDFTNGATGVARAENGGTLQLVGGSAGGNFNGGTFAALNGSTVQINTTTVSNAILSTTGTGTINIVGASTLSNVTNNGTLSTDGITTTLTGTLAGTGTVNVGGTGGMATIANLSGPVTLAAGTINLNNANSTIQSATTGDRFTIGAGARVTGQGNLGNGTTTITNNGYIIVNTGTLNIRPGGGTGDFTNGLTTGTNAAYVTANNGTTVHLDGGSGGTFTNTANGYFTVQSTGTATAFNIDAGKLTNLSGGTLSAGHYNVIAQNGGTATMSFGGGSITTLSYGAVVSLNGANSVFTEINALATNNGTLQTNDGRSITTASNLLSTGNLTVGGDCTLNVNGNLTFNTVVSPTTAPHSNLTMIGGTIVATGGVTMDASSSFGAGGSITATYMTLAGTIEPFIGFNGRLLTLNGSVTLQNTAHLLFDLYAPGAYNENLTVNGNFTLSGKLDVAALQGFGVGRYDLINYSGGTYTNNGLALGSLPDGYNYTLDYSTPGEIDLVVTNAVPEPATWALLAAGLVSLGVLRRRQSKASV